MAQLVARLNGIQKVRGSNPLGSTTKIPYILYGIFLFIFCLCFIDIWRFLGVDFVFGEKYNLDIRR